MTNAYRNTLLISANLDDNYLSATIVTCQEVYLEQITGTALYHRLQELVYNQITNAPDALNDPENEDYKLLLEDMVNPFLKARALVDVLYNAAFKIRNMGVMKSSDTNLQNADMSDIKYLEKQYLTYVAEYEQRLSKYLCANQDKFEELAADIPAYFDQPSLGKEYANDGGLWLGSKKKRGCGC